VPPLHPAGEASGLRSMVVDGVRRKPGKKLQGTGAMASGTASRSLPRYADKFHDGRQPSIHSSSIITFSYYKSPVDYSKSIAALVEAGMLSSSRDSPRTLSSILSGEGLYEMEHGGSQLAFSLPCLQLML
jgi:hypothetical protein